MTTTQKHVWQVRDKVIQHYDNVIPPATGIVITFPDDQDPQFLVAWSYGDLSHVHRDDESVQFVERATFEELFTCSDERVRRFARMWYSDLERYSYAK